MIVALLCVLTGFCLGALFMALKLVRDNQRRLAALELMVERLGRQQYSTDQGTYHNTRTVHAIRKSMSDVMRAVLDLDRRVRDTEVVHTEIVRSLPPPSEEGNRDTMPFPWGKKEGR